MNNALKAVSATDSELRVGNYIVLFGGKDLTGEFFTEKTHFDSSYTDTGLLYVDFEHGRDHEKAGNSQNNILGVVDWKSAKVDDKGVFVERVLNRRAQYVKYLEELINAGVVGTSSEAVGAGVRKKSTGEIVEWPLMRDSLTVTPMEPRMAGENVLTAAKALAEIFPTSKTLAVAAGNPIPDEPDSVLAEVEAITEIKHASEILRNAGFSKRATLALLSKVKSLSRSNSVEDEVKEIKAALTRRAPLNTP
jgi:phage head maturation protease